MQLNFTFPLHTVNASYKKVATPHPPFSGLSPLSTKIFVIPTQMTQFLEGPTHLPFNKSKGGGWSLNYAYRKYHLKFFNYTNTSDSLYFFFLIRSFQFKFSSKLYLGAFGKVSTLLEPC